MVDLWMVRAGGGGHLIDEFERENHVAIGWGDWIDLSAVESRGALRDVLVDLIEKSLRDALSEI